MIDTTLLRQNTVFGDGVVTGDLAVNGGDLTSTATTFSLLNTTVTTLNIGGAATAIAIGAATGTLTLNNPSVRFADGTVAAPSIAFASDTNTGVFRGGADDWRVAIGGVLGLWVLLDAGIKKVVVGDQLVFNQANSDTVLLRDAANTLALRNGANAQQFNLYATYTDGSNYEGGYLTAAAGSVTLGGRTAGTGTDDVYLVLSPAGAGTVVGSTAANGDLTLEGTSHATKTTSYVILQPTGGNVGIGVTVPATLLELENVTTITGAVTDGYSAALTLDPGYTAATAQTVTRHNYIDIQNVSVAGAGPAAVTNAAVLRFDAAVGTHLATVAASTKTTPGGVDGWIKMNCNGTLMYVPMYLSTTA